MGHGSRGFGRIEALVSVVVLSVGLVATSAFQGRLVSNNQHSRDRSMAATLAVDTVEEMRNLDFATIAAGTATATHGTTGYTRTVVVTPLPDALNPTRKEIEVVISWSSQQGTRSLSYNSIVAEKDVANSVNLAAGQLLGGGFVDPPQGGASYGDGATRDLKNIGQGHNTVTLFDGTSVSDGTISHVVDDGRLELIDSHSGEVLLILRRGRFSTISGRVYLDGDYYTPGDIAAAGVFAGISDTGYCANVMGHPGSVSDNSGNAFHYFHYRCYVGMGWHGNIGVLFPDNIGHSQAVVCLGDPNVTDNGTNTSRHPVVSPNRSYRGYIAQDDENGKPMYDTNGHRIYLSSGVLGGVSMLNHDFLVTDMPGTPMDTECQTALNKVTPNLFAEYSIDVVKEGNPGEFFCIGEYNDRDGDGVLESDEVSCPSPLPEGLGTPLITCPSRKSEVLEIPSILAGFGRSVLSQAGIIGQKSLLRDRHARPPYPPRPLVPHHPPPSGIAPA